MAKEEIKLTEEEKEYLELYDFWIEKVEWEDWDKYYTDIKGRPLKMTPKIVANLLSAFSHSLTDDEACIYTDISKNTLYRFVDKNPHFWHQKEILKQKPNIKAKLNKIKAINEWNIQESWWWLERKSRDEFSLKQEVGYTNKEWEDIEFNKKEIDNKPIEELKNLITTYINK